MCVVSMIGDHYKEKFKPYEPYIVPAYPAYEPSTPLTPGDFPAYPQVQPQYVFYPDFSRKEIEALREEVKEMKELLKKAKKYDKDNDEPNCEMEDKVALLKKIAKAVDVDLADVFEPNK